MKTDSVYKRAFNDVLDLVAQLGDGMPLPSENGLGARLGVSRTTVRKILSALDARGIVSGSGRQRIVHAAGTAPLRFPDAETVSMSEQVEKRFMEWMLRDNAEPGTSINELELARRFGRVRMTQDDRPQHVGRLGELALIFIDLRQGQRSGQLIGCGGD